MKEISIQIQTILYNNSHEMLKRSLQSIKNAIKIYNDENTSKLIVNVCYGDASSERTYDNDKILLLYDEFKTDFTLSYRFFNFNSGTALGHNILAENTNTDYLLLINPDILFCPRFFAEILYPFSLDNDIGIVEGRQTPIEHPKEYNLKTGETSWASGACSLIPTSLFKTVGGYDAESFFMYCDDVDLSWRVRLLGKKVIYQPRAVVFHSKQLSTAGMWVPTTAEIYYATEAELFMAQKWLDKKFLETQLKQFASSGDENQLKAYNKFVELKKYNKLPNPMERANEVASYIGGSYAWHRYAL